MKDRSYYQCHKIECDSPAVNQMRVNFHSLVRDVDFTCTSSIKVCDRHKRQAEEYILSPSNKTAISIKFIQEGLPPPDFDSFHCTWVPVVEGEMVEGVA